MVAILPPRAIVPARAGRAQIPCEHCSPTGGPPVGRGPRRRWPGVVEPREIEVRTVFVAVLALAAEILVEGQLEASAGSN